MSEVVHLRQMELGEVELGADLHAHMYGDKDSLDFVLIAELAPIAKHFISTPIDGHWWYTAPDGNRFCALTLKELRALGALVWHSTPGDSEQLALL